MKGVAISKFALTPMIALSTPSLQLVRSEASLFAGKRERRAGGSGVSVLEEGQKETNSETIRRGISLSTEWKGRDHQYGFGLLRKRIAFETKLREYPALPRRRSHGMADGRRRSSKIWHKEFQKLAACCGKENKERTVYTDWRMKTTRDHEVGA